MLTRRSLPLAAPCPLATAVQPIADGIGWCEHCRLHVHDLSAGTELEARALLRAHGRARLCVAYRTLADGTIAFREHGGRVAFSTAIALLVACTASAPIAAPRGPEPPTPAVDVAIGATVPAAIEPAQTDAFGGTLGEPIAELDAELGAGPRPPSAARPSRRARRPRR